MQRKLLFIAIITLGGNGLLGYFVFKSSQNRITSEYWVQHSMQVRNQVDKIFANENQVATSLKAYDLTRDPSFLKLLYVAKGDINKNLAQLTFLTKDNTLQQTRLSALHIAMRQFLDNSFQKVGIKGATPSDITTTGNTPTQVFNSRIRDILLSIQKDEAELLKSRIQLNEQDVNDVKWLTMVVFIAMAGFTVLLILISRKIFFQGKEKDLRAHELMIANEVLYFENEEKAKRADELVIANEELLYQNEEKEKRAAELLIAGKELRFESSEKKKRAHELVLADNELVYQNQEKEDRAAELFVANVELNFQNSEKEKRANELIAANAELLYQNNEKEKRAAELVIANEELSYQNKEKEKRASELKEMVSLLNKSEVFNRGILNSLTSHIAVMDKSGKIIAVNDSWNKFAVENGNTTLERTAVGNNYFDVCTRAMENGDLIARKAMQGIMEVLDETRLSFCIEYPINSIAKQQWFVLRAMKFDGADNLVVLSHLDITERKQAEQNLILSESSLKEAQSIAHIGSFKLDLIHKIDFWSDEMYNILGLDKNTTTPSPETFLRCVHPSDKLIVKRGADRTFKSLKRRHFEFRFIRSDGSLRYGLAELQFEVNEQKKPWRIIGIFKDVTKEKLAKLEKAKMVNDLVTRNKDLEQFGYIISHNFRAPIASILGASNALNDLDLSKQEEVFLKNGINKSVIKLDKIVKDLNIILEVKTDINEKNETVNFAELVDEIKDSLGGLLFENKINITYDFSAVEDMVALRPYLRSIFFNLISNSVKYRKEEIPAVINISSLRVATGIKLIFSDNGMGIDLSKNANDIFVMYKRFHEHIEGSGVGLFMVKTQVNALHGKINLSSKVDQGCVFTISFENDKVRPLASVA